MQRFTFLAALVLGLFAGPTCAQEKLAWKFKEGDKFYVEEKTTVKQNSEASCSMMPEQALKKGDTWERESNMSMGPIGSFKVGHSYKYEGDEKNLAVISGTAKLDYLPPKDAAGLPFKITKGKMQA